MKPIEHENITAPAAFHTQAFAQKGWRILAAGENTSTMTRSGGNQTVSPKESYRVIYCPDGGTISFRFKNNKGDQASNLIVPENFMMEGLFEEVVNNGTTTILVTIA